MTDQRNKLLSELTTFLGNYLQHARNHIIPNSIMSAFVLENKTLLDERPKDENDTRVTMNEAGIQRIGRLVDNYNDSFSYFLRSNGKDKWPTLQELRWAIELSFQYIPFDVLLQTLITIANHAVTLLLAQNNPKMLYCLAIPGSKTEKSSLWFSAFLWKYSNLPKLIDFIIPSTEQVQLMLNRLDNVEKGWEATILYIDDMSYSGTQMGKFGKGDLNSIETRKRVEIYPLVAYQSDLVPAALREFSGGLIFQKTLSNRVMTPKYWLEKVGVFSDRIGTIETPLIDDPYFEILKKKAGTMKPVVEFYQTIVDAVRLPIVFFEHKVADDVSISFAFVQQLPYFPEQGEVEEDMSNRQLVFFDRQHSPITIFGSAAFYKKLKWTYKGRELKNKTTTLVKSLFSVLLE